ncbi:MAG TPA: YdbL family protein [Sphingobium sp.]|nr:YdbL family protein [Sphingobium sp.]
MTRSFSRTTLVAALLGLSALGAAPAFAQDAVISAAKAAGTVGEQADGYLGIKGSVSGDVRSAVDALNIKRRAAYTDLAAKRGVTVQDMAAVTGCQTLASRVSQGQIYRIGAGDWQTKGAGPIALPDYCAAAGQ